MALVARVFMFQFSSFVLGQRMPLPLPRRAAIGEQAIVRVILAFGEIDIRLVSVCMLWQQIGCRLLV